MTYVSVEPPLDSTADHAINIIAEVYELKSEIVENRRWFHAHPELAYKGNEKGSK